MSSDFLFSNPSFLSGVARTLDLWAQLDSYNISPSPASADAVALRNDWRAVEEYLREAVRVYEQTKNETQEAPQLAAAAVSD